MFIKCTYLLVSVEIEVVRTTDENKQDILIRASNVKS